MHNTHRWRHRRHPRRVRLLRPGDARPRARAPGARAASRSAPTRSPASRRSALDPRLRGTARLPAFVTNDEALASGADLVFCCLDHERAAALEPAAGRRRRRPLGRAPARRRLALPAVVRLRASAAAELGDWCYALPELLPPTGALIANPGCYATAALLALAPLAGVVDRRASSSTPSRASRAPGRDAEGDARTRAPCSRTSRRTRSARHQHAPEIEQALGFPVCFVPHLLPVRRGLIATCYVAGLPASLRALLEAAYATPPP